jgi:1,4-alpha-glucan branching enzyme
MQVDFEDIPQILKNNGWLEIKVELPKYWDKNYSPIVWKHPSKKLYFYGTTFGEKYRVYKGKQIDIMNCIYTMSYNGLYEYNAPFKTLTHKDFICLNLG